MKTKITYEVKDERKVIVKKNRVFNNFEQANDFIKTIKTKSISKPIIEE
jgi:hypothetical protein